MEELTSNDVSRQKAVQYAVGNGKCRDENGNSMVESPTERVTKSRSHDWYSMSPASRSEGSYPKGTNHFPKSITANILSPKVFENQAVYENRVLKNEIFTSGRWLPNSIEDQERDTTRSSSNPAISSSISEDELGDRKNALEQVSPSAKAQSLDVPEMPSEREDDIMPPIKPAENAMLLRSDSLPHHRERLSHRRKRMVRQRREPPTKEESEHEMVQFQLGRSSSSSSEALFCKKERTTTPSRKIIPPKITTSLPQMGEPDDLNNNGACKRPRDLRLYHQNQNANSLANVGSWLANQSFDYVDSSYSAYNILQSQNSLCPIHNQPPCIHQRDEILLGTPTPRDVTFNVSGQHYRVDPDLLARFPDTLLGNREKRAKYWDSLRKEYFLDRHKATFEVVIEYYINNGTLTRPDDIPIDIFIHEIKFYCLDRQNLLDFLSAEGILLVVKEKPMPDTPQKQFIWNLFEDPESCLIARIVTTMSALVIAISVIVFCMETVPEFHSLGEESLKNIAPALHNCSLYLQTKTEYFQPYGNLFASDESATRTPGHHKRFNATSKIEHVRSPRAFREFTTREPTLSIQTIASDIAEGTTFDEFDGEIILSTMQQTLTICAAAELNSVRHMSLLSKYTYLRCETELTDAYEANPDAIFEIMKDLELHEHGHEEEAEDDHDTDHLETSEHEDGDKKKRRDRKMRLRNKTNTPTFQNITNLVEMHRRRANLTHAKLRRKHKDCNRKKRDRTNENEVFGNFKNCTKSPKRKEKRRNKAERHNNNITSVHKERNIGARHHRQSRDKHSMPDEDNTTKLLTLKQTIKGLNQLCVGLDNSSIRSSYAWFVLEASIGGAAGQLFLIESGCIVWFVIEIFLRFYSCPSKIKFCTNFLNIIDAIAIMPYFITLIVTSLHTDSNLRPQTATILRTIRLVRMLRILKLSRHSRGLRILGLTLVRSTRVLVLLVCFQMVLAVTFSSIVYYLEYDAEGTYFKSIPGTFWWAIITMTTVGYGDVVPITTAGKITGAFCAIMGILGIAFPVPVIVSNFNYLYNLDSDACKLTPEELMGDQEDSDGNNNVEKFQENLFDAVRRNVGSMTSAPQEGQPTGQNPAELWNYTRRQYHSEKRLPTSKPAEPVKQHKYKAG